MSQAKVDRYKESKVNRKSEVKKAKAVKKVRAFVCALVCIAILGWVGHSLYISYEGNKETESITVNYDAVDEFTSSMTESE